MSAVSGSWLGVTSFEDESNWVSVYISNSLGLCDSSAIDVYYTKVDVFRQYYLGFCLELNLQPLELWKLLKFSRKIKFWILFRFTALFLICPHNVSFSSCTNRTIGDHRERRHFNPSGEKITLKLKLCVFLLK